MGTNTYTVPCSEHPNCHINDAGYHIVDRPCPCGYIKECPIWCGNGHMEGKCQVWSDQVPEDVNKLRNEVERLIGTAILRNDKNYTDDFMQLFTAEQTKLLERLESELPDKYDTTGYSRSGGKGPVLTAHNDAIDQVRALLAKHKEGLKQ